MMENPSSNTLTRRVNSPEFEFWHLDLPHQLPPPSPLLSADELFSDGFLLPLHLLPTHQPDPDPETDPEPEPSSSTRSPEPETQHNPPASAAITSSAGNPILSASKRWKELFKRGGGEKKSENCNSNNNSDENKPEKSSEKRREKKSANGGGSSSVNNSAELNINIWPFSRSRSAGNNSNRVKQSGLPGRKASSAPCSRSNSSGESKTRKTWPNSPGRTGVHLGRASPVWQARRVRGGSGSNGGGGKKGRVLNLNVPMCIGYRPEQPVSCRSDDGAGAGGGGRNGGGNGNGNLFGLRGLFGKKSVVTV